MSPRSLGVGVFRIAKITILLVLVALIAPGSVTALSTVSPSNAAFAFHSQFVDQDPSPTLAPGATTTYSLRFRNTGLAAWLRDAGTPVALGVRGDATEFAAAGMALHWLTPNRLATTSESIVMPGMIATFRFSLRAPATPGIYSVPLRLVADRIAWLEDENVVLTVTSDLGFHSKVLGQSGHPTLKPGEISQPMTVTLRNTGAKTWVRGAANQQVNIGVIGDDKSQTKLSFAWPTADRVAVQTEPTVGPGGVATFTFKVRAPTTPGIYVLRLRPVADGVAWLEDDGLMSLITVVDSGAPVQQLETPTQANPGAPRFSVSGSADPATATAGTAVTVRASFTPDSAATAVVGIEVYAPDTSTLVYQKWFENESFGAGETRAYVATWQIPSTATTGEYSVNLRAFSPGWKSLYSSRSGAATFSVAAPAAAAASPAPVATSPGSTGGPTGTVAPTASPTALPSAGSAPPSPTATVAPTPVPTPSFTSTGSVAPASVVAGGSVNATAVIWSAMSINALVDIEIWAQGGTSALYQVWFDNQSFGAGQQRSYPATWDVPLSAAAGAYILKLGVFSPGWTTRYSWNASAATFSVATPAPSATPTPTPGPAFVSINDTDFVYAGTWSTSNLAGKYLGDDHYSDVAGSTFSITFNGTSLRLYSALASHHGIGAVSVDSGPESDIDFYGATRQEQALVYTTPTLASAVHTLRVRVTGRKNAASTGLIVTADRADIVGSAVTPTPTPTPTPTATPTPGPTSTPGPPPVGGLLPTNRVTTWNPGVPGGIPVRTTVCANVSAATYGNGSADATAGIQAALDACPVAQVVLLSAGDFKITDTLLITKGVVLRGQGPAQTKLKMPVGTAASLITVGTRWFKFTQSVNLAVDALKGTSTATLVNNPGLKVGEIVAIDTLTNTAITQWNPTRSPLGDVSRTWFTRPNRPLGQVLEIAAINGNSIVFTTPFHITFDTAHTAQLSRFSDIAGGTQRDAVKYAGVEDLYVYGGGDGNLKLANAAYSWFKNVESDYQKGEGIAIDASFRSVVRDSYVHSTQDPNPGGGGYGFSFSFYAADNLVENNISWNMNKVMVMRASGGGNVIAYNYMDDGWISYATDFVETGLQASHMTTPHFELFEGNQSFNFDGDNTWGNAVYITVFRNHLTGKRRSVAPLQLTDHGNARAIGLGEGHQWYNFVGNVLGSANQNPAPNAGYTYETTFPWNDSPVGMWRLGYNNDNWNAPEDTRVRNTMLREGNFDYATNQVHWTAAAQAIPASLYLTAKPAFFGSNPWPWVDATGGTKVSTLPARARFDAMPSH